MQLEKSIQEVEDNLTQQYGPARNNVAPGLNWLLKKHGYHNGSYPYYLDHPEYRIKDGKKTITARPYGPGVPNEYIRELVDIAASKNLRLFIERQSNYNTETHLIIITEQS